MANDPTEDTVRNGTRGTTTVHDRVGEQIGRAAALAVDGVRRHRGSLGGLTGGEYPRVSIDMSMPHPVVAVQLALSWPTPITAVCQEVRSSVHADLVRLTGTAPHRVDVTVSEVAVPDVDTSRRLE